MQQRTDQRKYMLPSFISSAFCGQQRQQQRHYYHYLIILHRHRRPSSSLSRHLHIINTTITANKIMKGRIIDSIIRSVSSRRVHCLSTAAALSSSSLSSSSSSSSFSTIITRPLYTARRRDTSSIINATTRRSTSTSTRSSTATSSTDNNGHNIVHEIKSRILSNIHPLQLFRIIQDVDSYTKFLPLCYKSKVYKDSIRNGGRQFNAELVVGFGGSSSNFLSFFGSSSGPLFKTRYTSQVIVNPNELTIETISDGSINSNSKDEDEDDNDDDDNHQRFFDSLSSSWKLRPYYNNDDKAAAINSNNDVNNNNIGTIVDFKVEMIGISNPIIRSLLNSVLYNVAEIQVTAFEKRCLQLNKDQDHLQSLSNQELLVANKFYKL